MTEKPGRGGRARSFDLRPLGLIAVAAAVVWSTAIAAGTWQNVRVRPEQRTIKVTGSAKKRITSDLIQWQAQLEAHAPDRTTAYKLLHDERDKAVAFLTAQGIAAAEIQPQSTTFEQEFETVEETKVLPGSLVPTRTARQVPKGFVTREVIVVRSSDVSRIEKASREITSLLAQGVSITSEPPRYFYTRLGELKVEQLAAAGKDARSRADNILKSAGGAKLGKLITADMGIININPANSTETSEEGNNDTSALEKDIITIVHAEFNLNDWARTTSVHAELNLNDWARTTSVHAELNLNDWARTTSVHAELNLDDWARTPPASASASPSA